MLSYPSITCNIDNNDNKTVTLVSHQFKLFLQLTSGNIAFKHPDIERYINTMRHYQQLALNNPLW